MLRSVEVPAFGWADVVGETRPRALLMDIEGGELDLLTSVDLKSVERIVVELHPAAYGMAGLARIYAALDHQGFFLDSAPSEGSVLAVARP